MHEFRQGYRPSGATSDRILRLEHDHGEAGGGKLDRRGEPVRARSDDDRVVAQSSLVDRKGFAIRRKGAPAM